MYAFEYSKAKSADDASKQASADADAKIVAGGMTSSRRSSSGSPSRPS